MAKQYKLIHANEKNLRYKVRFCLSVCVCLSVCFNFSGTAIGTSIKLSTIDHHPMVSAIRVFVTSS